MIAAAVFLILLVAIDRVAALVAQHKVAARIATAYELPTLPSVTIQGFPFLTQVAAGRYKQVNVAASLVAQGGGVQLRDLRASFSGVTAPLRAILGDSTGMVSADHASATALVPFATVQRRLPPGITLAEDGGELKLMGKLGYQGLQIPVSAAVTLRVTSRNIEISPRNLSVAGALPVPAGPIGGRLTLALPLRELPMHLKVTSVRVTDGGFELTASARGAEFENSG